MFSEAARCVEGGNREPGCWRIRLNPDAPMPCSCSGTMGDLWRVSATTQRMHLCFSLLHVDDLPRHAVQLPGIDAQPLRCIYMRRSALGHEVGRALILDQRDMFGSGTVRGQGIEVGTVW